MVDSKISRYLSLKKSFLCFLRIFDRKFEYEISSEYTCYIYQNEALFTENMFMLLKLCICVVVAEIFEFEVSLFGQNFFCFFGGFWTFLDDL